MCISLQERTPELAAVIEAMLLRRGAFGLKARVLRAVHKELRTAKESGLTWQAIWSTLRDEGYPGCYQQFCKAANRAIGQEKTRKNLPAPAGGKVVGRSELRPDRQPEQINSNQEKPEWQVQREELMARLDREAESNRQREAQLRPRKIFRPSAFVGRSED
jgi:hypothetical protein